MKYKYLNLKLFFNFFLIHLITFAYLTFLKKRMSKSKPLFNFEVLFITFDYSLK